MSLTVAVVAAVVGGRWVAVTATSTVAAGHSAISGQAFSWCINSNANTNANTRTSTGTDSNATTGRGTCAHASSGRLTDGRVRLAAADIAGALAAASRPQFCVIDGVTADGGQVTQVHGIKITACAFAATSIMKWVVPTVIANTVVHNHRRTCTRDGGCVA